ncbi:MULTISPECIES: SDR family NAD(P)-dependent oxidoreductase [unclassified Pseudomonas]|uniref:SDR family NAD(P)-dependent oxidoreductase n=1 Tax=unclassified Pseudomonas TaxID=196821 RepID=UPI000F560BC4|nr:MULTISPECIES: SDR family oxidoreductase [unclassified Pseudomonas]AZF21126.1 3-oxoacyl-ACP reductase [Pseudomonas sp. R3-52-08]AZF26469.1 3-oxoacyl-ACP reductase [Pseudomonas sp. R2-60-08W]AZF31818.1 3-oxoacyl-ACP reductase [Pseudomonas sp. R4-35-07]AZF37101.1 3-oxoacyl-ACP reductase [Pseudomonas sp. R4-39-08]AZF42263.1 3-oxoacyl-ACP reductase [Pseudomonas sp. R1-43-08]
MSTQQALYPDLKGKTVLISGGASGIGEFMVRAFAAQGAKVAFVDRAQSQGERLAALLNSNGHSVEFECCDITDEIGYRAAIGRFEHSLGPITVLVNNAANDVRHTLEEIDSEMFDRLIAVNLKHAFFAAKAVVPMMKQAGGGSIINLGSVGWMMASAGYPVYAASKAAAHGMTRGLARELGPHHIRVNTLVPGWVMTEKQLAMWVDDAARELIARSQCLPGSVMPEHIANMALFLASDASAMCSAQNFIVDGGWV